MLHVVWDKGKGKPASWNSSLGLLSIRKPMAGDEFWKQMVNKFPHSLLEGKIARMGIQESWGVSLKTASLR